MKKENIITIIIISVALLIYFLLTDIFNLLDFLLFPSLIDIVEAFVKSMPELIEAMISSSQLLLPAYGLALLTGILLGLLIGLTPTIAKATNPIISGLMAIPPSTLTPYLIALMPTFHLSSSTLLFIAAFWRVLTGMISGIQLIDQRYLNISKLLELKGFKFVNKVVLPAAAPSILSGARSGLNVCFILLPVAEMFATDSGIGYFIQYYADFAEYANVIVGIIFMALYVVIIMSIFGLIRNRILSWSLNENN